MNTPEERLNQLLMQHCGSLTVESRPLTSAQAIDALRLLVKHKDALRQQGFSQAELEDFAIQLRERIVQ